MFYLFHGKNSYLSFKEAKSLLEKVREKREKQSKAIDEITLDGSSQKFEKIINEVETPSFFSTHKIIFLKRPTDNKEKVKIKDWIIEMVQNTPKRRGIDMVIWEDKKIRSNSKLLKSFGKNTWESPNLKPRSFTKWANDEIKKEKFQIDRDAIDMLSQRVNYEPERFFHEVEKLRLLNKEKITVEDIEKVAPDTLEHSIWDLIDSINDGKREKAGELLNNLIQQGNDPYYILSMLSRNMRIILLTKLLLKREMSSSEIAKHIGTHPFVISKVKNKSRNIEIERIKKIYEKLVSIDYSTKTGQIEIELALNILISVI